MVEVYFSPSFHQNQAIHRWLDYFDLKNLDRSAGG